MTSFYDKNIILKLYNSLEYFIKSVFYDRYEQILQTIPYNSKELKVMFGCDRLRADFNLHYKHPYGELNNTIGTQNEGINLMSIGQENER